MPVDKGTDDVLIWRIHLYALAAVLVAVMVVYWPTIVGMVSIWIRSETFAHGFFVFPISAWLIYRMRKELAMLSPRVDWWAVTAQICCGFAWMLGHAAGVHVVQQYAVVAFIPATVWLLLGRSIAWKMAFPLGFMLMAVPAGEVFIPKLMQFTAWFTTLAIRLTGIPVFRDGMSITLPHGNWSIATACSGIRYLMAMLTVGLLFGYLSYRSVWRRTAFAGLAVLTAVIGNGLRAYGIVMIGYLSNLRYAHGTDHLVYGWLFFGVLVAVLLAIGEWWREPASLTTEVSMATQPAKTPYSSKITALALLVGLVAILCWPVTVAWRIPTDRVDVPLPQIPTDVKGWSSVIHLTSWEPEFKGYAALMTQTYRRVDRKVGLYIAWYPIQTQGRELISSSNVLVSEGNREWQILNHDEKQLELDNHKFPVRTAILRSGEKELLVWQCYWIAGTWVSNPFYAKMLQSLSTILHGDQRGAALFLYTPIDTDRQHARDSLRDFLKSALPDIERSLDSSSPSRR